LKNLAHGPGYRAPLGGTSRVRSVSEISSLKRHLLVTIVTVVVTLRHHLVTIVTFPDAPSTFLTNVNFLDALSPLHP
jgi:hypothetical protein